MRKTDKIIIISYQTMPISFDTASQSTTMSPVDMEKATEISSNQSTRLPSVDIEKGPEVPVDGNLYGGWDGLDDKENPMNWPLGKKVYMVLTPAVISFVA